jgi:protein-S-isoprenylcysteine O-methyltransferase Ste14
MLCVLIGTGILLTPRLLFLFALAVFFAGTAIRMRVEDKLLQSHFGAEFSKYRHDVRGIIPFVW